MAATARLRDYALQYAARGWRVFPLNGKIPLKGSRGFHDATCDAATIAAWWSQRGHNIGLATGNGLVVLDPDGAGGRRVLSELVAACGPLPRTLVSRTARGLHLFYKSGLRSMAGLGRAPGAASDGGLDVKSDGGYVVLPPSLHPSGVEYAWQVLHAVAELPAAHQQWLEEKGGRGRDTERGSGVVAGAIPAWLAVRPAGAERDAALRVAGMTEWTAHEEARLRAALAFVDADSYESWLSVGLALFHLAWDRSDGTSLGFELWQEFSQRAPEKYAEAVLEQKWASFGKSYGNRREITAGSIYWRAQQGGWDGRVEVAAARGDAPTVAGAGPAAGGAGVGESGTDGGEGGDDDQDDAVGADAGGAVAGVNGHAALPAIFHSDPRPPIVFPDTNRAGLPTATCRNARVAIVGLGVDCQHDTFHNRMTVGGHAIEQWSGELSDDALQMLRVAIEREFAFDPGIVATHDAAVQECLLHRYDPVVQYLDSVAWDGVPRLQSWLQVYLGAENTELNAEIGRLALVAAVRRARTPGAKFDQIIVLEGEEGKNKSTAIEIMAGEGNFSDQTILGASDREVQELLQGVWLYEIADLTGISRADTERVKAFASRRVDRARPAYGRMRVDKPRRCIMFATTNDRTYLRSATGNRRFWPVVTGHIQIKELARDRDQLWAEAAALERGASVALPERLWKWAAALQESRREHDPWDDVLAEAKGKPGGSGLQISTRDLLDLHLRLPTDRQNDMTSKRLAFAMRRLGWDGPKPIRDGERVLRGYTKTVLQE